MRRRGSPWRLASSFPSVPPQWFGLRLSYHLPPSASRGEDGQVEELRRRLETAGLDEASIGATCGTAPNPEAASLHVRLLAATDPRAVLVQLFVLGEQVQADALPIDVGDLEAAGLVERDGDFVGAPLRLTPHEGLLLVHDGENNEHDPNHVGGMNSATRTMATLTIRRPVDRALDLGTGSGVQALLAARHAQSV